MRISVQMPCFNSEDRIFPSPPNEKNGLIFNSFPPTSRSSIVNYSNPRFLCIYHIREPNTMYFMVFFTG